MIQHHSTSHWKRKCPFPVPITQPHSSGLLITWETFKYFLSESPNAGNERWETSLLTSSFYIHLPNSCTTEDLAQCIPTCVPHAHEEQQLKFWLLLTQDSCDLLREKRVPFTLFPHNCSRRLKGNPGLIIWEENASCSQQLLCYCTLWYRCTVFLRLQKNRRNQTPLYKSHTTPPSAR